MTLAHAGGAVTDWLTAIGTVGAVVVALVLARRQNAEYLRVTCQVGYVACGTRDGMGGYVGDKLEPFVRISATNDGPSPVTVNTFGWRAGWVTKKYWWQPMAAVSDNRLPAPLPARGDEAKVLVPAERLIGEADSISALVRSSRVPWLTARSIKVSAGTTTGRTFYGRPHASVLAILTSGEMPPDRPA